MIKTVLGWANGMVAVCDENGKQMPEYQGLLSEKREAILRDSPADARFFYWKLPDTMRKEDFERYTAWEVDNAWKDSPNEH